MKLLLLVLSLSICQMSLATHIHTKKNKISQQTMPPYKKPKTMAQECPDSSADCTDSIFSFLKDDEWFEINKKEIEPAKEAEDPSSINDLRNKVIRFFKSYLYADASKIGRLILESPQHNFYDERAQLLSLYYAKNYQEAAWLGEFILDHYSLLNVYYLEVLRFTAASYSLMDECPCHAMEYIELVLFHPDHTVEDKYNAALYYHQNNNIERALELVNEALLEELLRKQVLEGSQY